MDPMSGRTFDFLWPDTSEAVTAIRNSGSTASWRRIE
jgi:hypothetical protein